MNNKTYVFDKRLSKAQAAALFFACLIIPALLSLGGCLLAKMQLSTGMPAPFTPNGRMATILWPVCYAIAGISLFFIFTADSYTGTKRTIQIWSLSLWGIMFVLGLIWPFFFYLMSSYMLSFVFLVITCAVCGALFVLNLKLHPLSSFLLIPFFIFSVLFSYAAIYAAVAIL